MIEELKKHWFVSILLVCVAVAGTTWKVAYELLVAPREFQIAQLKDENQKLKSFQSSPPKIVSEKDDPLALEETGVFANTSVTTRDGRCNIRIIQVIGNLVKLAVAVDSLPPKVEDHTVGSRVAVDAGDRTYYVDLHRVRGDIVDLSVSQRKK